MTQAFMKMKYDFYGEWITRKRNRITRRNKNWLCVWTGGTGDGKSWGAGRTCERIDKNFIDDIKDYGIKSRIAWGKPIRFMEMLNRGIEDKTIKKGTLLMFDEAGVGMPAREWYSQANKMFSYVMQTFRSLNLGVIFTVPDLSFIDSQPRKLFHNYIESLGVNYKKKCGIVKPFEMKNNPKEDVIYFSYPRFHAFKIKRFYISKPHKDFIKSYEIEKEKFNEELRIEAEEECRKHEVTKEHKRLTDERIMKTIKEEQIELNAYTLQFKFNIGKDRAYRIIKNFNKFSPSL